MIIKEEEDMKKVSFLISLSYPIPLWCVRTTNNFSPDIIERII